MTSIEHASLALLTVALVAGCASDPQAASSGPKGTREYRSGSSIPVRNARPTTEAERERDKAELEEIRRQGGLGQSR